MTEILNLAVIGCGLIGRKRASAAAGAQMRLRACSDTQLDRAQQLAAGHAGCEAFADALDAIRHPEVEAVCIATPHDSLALLIGAAIDAGKHVLVEKPAARHADELAGLAEVAHARGLAVRVGFNHRYHRAFQQARQIVDSGALGELMFVRARYGHGGRPGYDREWRADPAISGGGELIDQGVHLVDLAGWFLGPFTRVDGFAHTYFWDMPVDDNGFMLLRTATDQTAFLHASCTEWKNTFSFEIYGRKGKLHVEGLGGSYGVEKLSWYQMQPEMGPPPTTVYEYPMEDNSWKLEMAEFGRDAREGRTSVPGLGAASAALNVVNSIYKASGYDHRP